VLNVPQQDTPGQLTVDQLDTRLRRLEAEYRRVCEELDWRDEKIRVLERVVRRLGRALIPQ
jgi:hypothetical protein